MPRAEYQKKWAEKTSEVFEIEETILCIYIMHKISEVPSKFSPLNFCWGDSIRVHHNGRKIKVLHPFLFRLPDNSIFDQNNPESLIGTGFSAIALAIFTIFRPTPFLLITLIKKLKPISLLNEYEVFAPYILYAEFGFTVSNVTIGGILMMCSRQIRNRKILMLPPWGLLWLYIDPLFWISNVIYLHVTTSITIDERRTHFENIDQPIIFFICMYIDCTLFFIIYYLFATYFIVAQLTVIEKFY